MPETGRMAIATQLGPLNIKLLAIRATVSALTLDLVRGFPKQSSPDEPKIECEIRFEQQLITLTESREDVSAYILDLVRGYPEVAAEVVASQNQANNVVSGKK